MVYTQIIVIEYMNKSLNIFIDDMNDDIESLSPSPIQWIY